MCARSYKHYPARVRPICWATAYSFGARQREPIVVASKNLGSLLFRGVRHTHWMYWPISTATPLILDSLSGARADLHCRRWDSTVFSNIIWATLTALTDLPAAQQPRQNGLDDV